jgi:orotidine-5'-phosphate decarboxylase
MERNMGASQISPAERLIVALDVDTQKEAMSLVSQLGHDVTFYKVGLQLFMESGLHIVKALVSNGKKVFLDLKIDDTPRTVQEAVRNTAIDGVEFFTLQGNGDTAKAAKEGRGNRSSPKFLQVTYLSSWDTTDLIEHLNVPKELQKKLQGQLNIDEMTVGKADRILTAGCDGVIASGTSVSNLRRRFPNILIVTPGIRPSGTNTDDHKRSMTPQEAISAGSDYLVVGRPIRTSTDPSGTARRIQSEIQQALASKAA